MKKTFLLFAAIFCICTCVFATENSDSDLTLYNEINLAWKNHFYPGTVDKVNQMEKQFPDSVFIPEVLTYKGGSLINMARYDEAVETLGQAISHMHTGSPLITQATYLLGKSFYLKKDYKSALENFHLAASLALTDENLEFYNPSILYAGKIYYLLENYEKAYPLFEYVIRNGKNYDKKEYGQALQKLMLSYNKAGESGKTLALFNQFNKEDFCQNFDDELYFSLCLYNADAHKNLNENKEAYDFYCQVIECQYEYLAVIALKKAYVLASEKNIGVNPGQVFSKTVDTFKDHPQLVNEFWIRLGIDEYNKKNYKKAEEYFANVENSSSLVIFYRAKILLDRDKNPGEAEKLLRTIEIGNLDTDAGDFVAGDPSDTDQEGQSLPTNEELSPNFSDAYYSLLLTCKFQEKQWDEIPDLYAKIKNPDSAALYALSASYYEKGLYEKVDPQTGLLYASALCKMGNFPGAVKVFEKLEADGQLGDVANPLARGEYAKALFACGRYGDAYAQAQKMSGENQKEYILGLCQINLKNWSLAQNHFANYIKLLSGKKDFINLAFFYKGYAEYSLEQYKNAYASFIRFASEAGKNQQVYTKNAYEYAAKSALQNGDFKNAAVQAENLIKFSTTTEEKHQAVIFSTDILSDYQNYDRALEILSPYLNEKSDFAVQAMFATAKIYEKKSDVKTADSYYQKIYREFPESAWAEEAMYRSGEVYYSAGDYATALTRFNNYIYKYVDGKLADAALFFGGDAALKLGEINRAVLLNTTLLSKYKDSVYAYGANKNLLAAYYEQESYSLALAVAKTMVKDFPNQAVNDEIGSRVIELEKIVNGTDAQVAQKESEYEKQGKEANKKGRITGSELVKLYAQSASSQKQAFELAMQLLPKQTKNDERKYAAENAEFIADYYRKNSENKKAGQMYLTAAEYYRSLDDSSKAAASLYGAAESFVAEGLYGDARETANLLKELYPESRQAQRVEGLF